ncbi:MAG: peptidase [Alteromonadaceae bacterium]|nr:peptidase [Alteromonadaceae bacterium]MBH85053.1 peptidase [Alteromonadaceae bacterium]|tara:strand:+ start:52119 stop:52667 length:549 start_codon:yes stop_codon:yes gene_type:complete
MTAPEQPIIHATRAWLERAVIGLNLCPFARAPYLKAQVHFAVSEATANDALIDDLVDEIQALMAADPEERETSLLILSRGLSDFADFNDFLSVADALLETLELDGILQIASFHPDYQFADTAPDDIENYTNRSPYPVLHLLRESSITRAVDTMDDTDAIYRANINTLQRLGLTGWQALWKQD